MGICLEIWKDKDDGRAIEVNLYSVVEAEFDKLQNE